MKQRFIIIVIIVAAILLLGPFLIPLPRQPDLTPEEVAQAAGVQGGRFITLDDYQTFIQTAGPANGQAVVLIHGFGGSTFSWRETLPALAAQDYYAIAIDLKGFGFSDKTFDQDYSHQAQAAFVIEIMDRLEVDQAVMIGHSMGANVIAHLALSYPERVNKLVIVDGAVVTGDEAQTGLDGGGWLLRIPQFRRIGRIAARSVMSEEQIGSILETAVSDPASLTPAMIQGYYAPLTIKDWELSLFGIMRDRDQNALPEPVEAITHPTLIIWGEEDTWVEPGRGEDLLETLPNARASVIREAGHLPMEERPEQFNAILLSFLEDDPAG